MATLSHQVLCACAFFVAELENVSGPKIIADKEIKIVLVVAGFALQPSAHEKAARYLEMDAGGIGHAVKDRLTCPVDPLFDPIAAKRPLEITERPQCDLGFCPQFRPGFHSREVLVIDPLFFILELDARSLQESTAFPTKIKIPAICLDKILCLGQIILGIEYLVFAPSSRKSSMDKEL